MPTNLERWFKAFENCESSDLVIEWNLYGAVSAALARNVAYCSWPHHEEPSALYPNLYVIIVGPPGAGKSLPTRTTRSLFRKFGGFDKVGDYMNRPVNIAPNSMTIQVMWQHMALMGLGGPCRVTTRGTRLRWGGWPPGRCSTSRTAR